MPKLLVFNSISIDGYFVDAKGDMGFAHNTAQDDEWNAFVAGNASGGGTLVFGRITYDLMASFWSSPLAAERMPVVAERMNALPKIVFSRTLDAVKWRNTTLLKGDPVDEIRRLKSEPGPGMVILGSGSIVSQLALHGLVDEYQFVVIPTVLGAGRTMFEGLRDKLSFRLISSRSFKNGNVVLSYKQAAG